MPQDHLLVRTARGENVERPPVWAMRQAGRWDSEFQKVRVGQTFYEFSENVELSAKASLLPKRFGVDAIILFYDITTLTISMGLPFTLQPNIGPVPDSPIRTMADVDKLNAEPPPESYQHIRDLLRVVKEELKGELPVIVFAGAPFTLATYCIGTGKHMDDTRQFVREQPQVWQALLTKIETATVHFLRTLVHEGADLYQLFDSWAGMLTEEEYRTWAHPSHQEIIKAVDRVPRILFVKECPFLEMLTQSGADVISLGKLHNLAEARRNYPNLVFQGNVDQEVLQNGSIEQVQEETRRCLQEGGGHRHIVNLNHGVDKSTPMENFVAYVETVQGSQ